MPDFVSLSEFAVIVGVSEPTVRKRFSQAGDGAPIAKRGKNGEAYEIPMPAGAEWWKAQDEAALAALNERQRQVAAMQLDFLGGDSAVQDQELAGLTPAEMSAQLEAELKAIKIAEVKGDLVRVADVEIVVGIFMAKVSDILNSLPDRLRKRADVPAEVADVLERLVHRDLHELADAAEKIGVDISATEEGAAANPAIPARV